jgi:hypothetical protein
MTVAKVRYIIKSYLTLVIPSIVKPLGLVTRPVLVTSMLGPPRRLRKAYQFSPVVDSRGIKKVIPMTSLLRPPRRPLLAFCPKV